MLKELHDFKINSLIVEGGAKLLNSFIDLNLWDEARVFKVEKYLNDGIKAPTLPDSPITKIAIGTDQLQIFKNIN